jgi:hypothetical protein
MRFTDRSLSTVCSWALILGVALAIASVSATGAAGSLDLGVGLGLMNIDDKTRAWGGEDARAELRLGYFINDQLELEAQVIVRTPEAIFDNNFNKALMLNGVYYFLSDQKSQPYLLLGIGRIEMEGPGGWFGFGPDDEALAYQAALGARFYPSSERFSIRVELSAISEDTFDERSVHFSLVGGVAWRFGE